MSLKEKYSLQRNPFLVPTEDGKYIAEHFGLATDGSAGMSVAHMIAPPGWSEPYQTPDFDEYTLVVKGQKQVEVNGETLVLKAGESIKVRRHVRVRYSNPFTEPCEYVAICTPAFTLGTAHREA
ncbi:cupin domain-containing protein [Maribacter sp. 2307ULW6-5]|uniref:cupin domain-containing protein n=1 Tax=Maribacter sp. 2307ULW6-5 TaxID=3386275 RepID=UPI0039BC7668